MWSTDFQEGYQQHSMGKGQSFQHGVLGKMNNQMQKNKVDTCVTPHTKINSRCIKDLKIVAKTMKLFKENRGGIFMTLDLVMLS